MPTPQPTDHQAGLTRLLVWLSPAFPIGGYSYSHGLEYAVESGRIPDADSLRVWVAGCLRHGSGRQDAVLFACSHRALAERNWRAIEEVARWAHALRATRELALESRAQGEAFLETLRVAWPHPDLDRLAECLQAIETPPAHALAVAAACALHDIPLQAALSGFLLAFAQNLVSAGVRLVPLGQTQAQQVIAALEPCIEETVTETRGASLSEAGSAGFSSDLCSARHETQYTRLFRS